MGVGTANIGTPNMTAYFCTIKGDQIFIAKPCELGRRLDLRNGLYHRYRVVIKGSTVEFYIDGELICTLYDPRLGECSGYVGLHCGFKKAFRNLRVKPL